MTKGRYIVVEGPIGVGKTSLARILANEFQARTVFERVEDNPFLPKFYKTQHYENTYPYNISHTVTFYGSNGGCISAVIRAIGEC